METGTDETPKAAVLAAALPHAAEEGFTESVLARAAAEAGVAAETVPRLFPEGVPSLVAYFSASADAEMERRLAAQDLGAMKIRARIRAAVLARIDALAPHKEAARRAASFLMLPMQAALGAQLVWRSVDAMWRAAGDTSTDFNFYSKRGILAGVYSATLMRWFNDASDDRAETCAFLDARIENVMQFEKLKAEFRARAKDWPGFADLFSGPTAPKA
jgi:ubiquinone biosynthesis protein COQ9